MTSESWFLITPGARPAPRKLARHLWGDADFDSDGNCDINLNWTELTLIRRPDRNERLDIDPISKHPLVLEICSKTPGLARIAAEFLVNRCGGTLAESYSANQNL